jgi:hypothetical protein
MTLIKKNKNIKLVACSFFNFEIYSCFLNKINICSRHFFMPKTLPISVNKNYMYFFFFKNKINFKKIYIFFKINFIFKKFTNNKILNFNKKIKKNFYFIKLIRLFNQLFWFNLHTLFAKYIIIFTLKNIFFTSVYRDNFLRHKIKIAFFETKKIEFLTATLVAGYIVRNLKAGHSLNRIIYPLLRNLARSRLYNGWKIGCSGRFKRRGRAQRSWFGRQGVALNTISSQIDFTQQIVRLRNGVCCVKVFLSRKPKYVYYI